MSPENVELVKAFFDAYNARDSEAVDRLLDPDPEVTTLSARAGFRPDGNVERRDGISTSSTSRGRTFTWRLRITANSVIA